MFNVVSQSHFFSLSLFFLFMYFFIRSYIWTNLSHRVFHQPISTRNVGETTGRTSGKIETEPRYPEFNLTLKRLFLEIYQNFFTASTKSVSQTFILSLYISSFGLFPPKLYKFVVTIVREAAVILFSVVFFFTAFFSKGIAV